MTQPTGARCAQQRKLSSGFSEAPASRAFQRNFCRTPNARRFEQNCYVVVAAKIVVDIGACDTPLNTLSGTPVETISASPPTPQTSTLSPPLSSIVPSADIAFHAEIIRLQRSSERGRRTPQKPRLSWRPSFVSHSARAPSVVLSPTAEIGLVERVLLQVVVPPENRRRCGSTPTAPRRAGDFRYGRTGETVPVSTFRTAVIIVGTVLQGCDRLATPSA